MSEIYGQINNNPGAYKEFEWDVLGNPCVLGVSVLETAERDRTGKIALLIRDAAGGLIADFKPQAAGETYAGVGDERLGVVFRHLIPSGQPGYYTILNYGFEFTLNTSSTS